MPNIFDQLAAESTPSDAGGGGNIFDQLAAKQPQSTANGPESFGAVHNAINAGFSGINSLANLGIRGLSAAGIVSPERADAAMSVNPLPYDPNRLSGKVGSAIGHGVEAVAAPPLAPALFTAEGGENAIENVTGRVAAGQNISTSGAVANVAGQAGLGGLTALMAPGGVASKGLIGLTPTLENAGLNAAKNIGIQSAVAYPEGYGLQVAGNALNRATGVNPNQALTEGANEAGLTNAVGAGVGQALHEAIQPRGPAAPSDKQGNIFDQIASEQHVAGLQDRLNQPALPGRVGPGFETMVDPSAPEPHLGYAHELPNAPKEERIPESEKPPGETPGFEKPEEVPQTPDETEVTRPFLKRLRDLQVENEQRKTANPQPPEGQAERRAWPAAQFETPEEAGANKFFENKRAEAPKELGELANTPWPTGEKPLPDQLQDRLEAAIKGETPSAEQEKSAEPGLLNRLATEEKGGTEAFKNVAERDIVPAVSKAWEGLKGVLHEVNRESGLNFGKRAKAGQEAELNLRGALGKADLESHKFASQISPALEHMPKFSEDPQAAIKWAEDYEAGGNGGIKELAPVVDFLRKMKQENAEEAEKAGFSHLDPTGNTLNRLATFPDEKGGDRGSIAGNMDRLRAQKLEKFGDFHKAVTEKGGKMDFDDPLSMQIAGQFEFKRLLAAHNAVREENKAGNLEWVPEGKSAVNPDAEKLKDPIVGSEERDVYWPKWKGGKYGNTEGGFNAEKFREQHTANPIHYNEGDARPENGEAVYLRPGEKPPEGYVNSGKTVNGHFYGDEYTAAKYNNLLPAESNGKIADFIKSSARASVGMRYGASFVHGVNGLYAGFTSNLGIALDRALHNEWSGAAKSVGNALTGGTFKGLQIARAIKAGTAGEVGERVAGTDVAQISPKTSNSGALTDKSWWPAAKEEFAAKNPIGGVGRVVKGIWDTAHDINFKHAITNVVLGNVASHAENAINRGVSAEEGRAALAKQADVISDAIGHNIRTRGFQDGVIRDISRIIAPASRFHEGQLRVLTQSLRGNPAALSFMASHLAVTALTGTALCYAMSGHMPRTIDDCFNPPTGNEDDKGNEERLSIPGFGSQLYRWYKNAGGEVNGLLSAPLKAGYEAAVNQDWRGNQVRPTDASAMGNLGRVVKHVGEGLLPMSSSPILNKSPDEGGDEALERTVEGAFGVRTSHPPSAATQKAYDILNRNPTAPRNLEEQQKQADITRYIKEERGDQADQDKAETEMANDPNVSNTLLRDIRKRAQEPTGLAGLILDPRFKPQDMLDIYNTATDAEKTQLKDSINQRVPTNTEYNRMDEAERATWDKLLETIK